MEVTLSNAPRTLYDYLEKRLGPGVARTNGEVDFSCPFCLERVGDESSKPKLGVNLDRRMVHCFRCGYGARSFIRLFRDLNGGKLLLTEIELLRNEVRRQPDETVSEALRRVLGKQEEQVDQSRLKCPALPDGMIWLSRADRDGVCKRAFQYLKSRGVNRRRIKELQLGYCPWGEYAKRIIFPVFQGGDMVYWTNRTILDGDSLKSKNPENKDGYYTRSQVLLNYDRCVGSPVVAISEGPFDIAVQKAAVGTLGKTISESQLVLLDTLVEQGTEEFVIALDAGESATLDRWFRMLSGRYPKVTAVVLDHGDPNSRRDDWPELLAARGVPSLSGLLAARFQHKK